MEPIQQNVMLYRLCTICKIVVCATFELWKCNYLLYNGVRREGRKMVENHCLKHSIVKLFVLFIKIELARFTN